jgi:hypothetical protein
MSLLLTSRTVHAATLYTLYRHITIPHSRIFRKFLSNITAHPALGTIVRRLDFSHFNPATIFDTASERARTQNLTATTLRECLELAPHLQEFLAQEYIEDDLGPEVLAKLFFDMPRLQALDFCGSSSVPFKNSFTALLSMSWPEMLPITRLSLHKCLTLPSALFETVLPRLVNLTHLDIAGTRVTNAALESIPATARITHLNLAKCRLLSAEAVINFLASHPSVISSLEFLSVATDFRSHQLFDIDDITQLLAILPRTLKSLSIKGSKMDQVHIPLLRPLMRSLEELSIGRNFTIQDVNQLFEEDEGSGPFVIKYLDLSDILGRDLDLSFLFGNKCHVLKNQSLPLEVVEIDEESFKVMAKSPQILDRVGWAAKEFGSRSWMVRFPSAGSGPRDDGQRRWKMGADSWGMRKIPVARAEVGGMYGSFMFGRKL